VAVPADEPEPDVPETSCKTKIVRMLVVFIVVSQTFGNIMYYIRLAGTIESAFIAVLVYIFVLQLTVIAKHQP
jgi:membrane protein YdbS with pleckstrin-like domain